MELNSPFESEQPLRRLMQYYVDLCECINTALFRAELMLLYFRLLGAKGAGDWASLLYPVERLCWNGCFRMLLHPRY